MIPILKQKVNLPEKVSSVYTVYSLSSDWPQFAEDSLVDDSLLQDDDEEEDDNESRSWRR